MLLYICLIVGCINCCMPVIQLFCQYIYLILQLWCFKNVNVFWRFWLALDSHYYQHSFYIYILHFSGLLFVLNIAIIIDLMLWEIKKFEEDQNLMRAIKEAIYIRVNNPSLNRNIGKYHLPHIWDEVLLNNSELKLK